MKLSIFPKSNNLPKSKEEKSESAKMAIIPEVVEVTTEDDLIETIRNFTWSPIVFSGNRKQENFLSSDFAVLDIDEGLTIPESEAIISDLKLTCLCMVTTSHTAEKHRFRLIFPLIRTITRTDEYVATMTKLAEKFPMADSSCIQDFARLYFSATLDDGYWLEGDFLPIETPKPLPKQDKYRDSGIQVKVDMKLEEIVEDLYGEKRQTIPESIHYFLENAHTGLPGAWTTSLNACVFSCAMAGIDEDTIMDLMEYLAPRGELTKKDLGTISRAFKDGRKVYEEQENERE